MRYSLVSSLLVLFLCLLYTLPVLATDMTVTAVPDFIVVPPTVTANSATNISNSLATLHGNITATGGQNATKRGFEWGLASGNYTFSWNDTGSFGIGAFDYQVTNLTLMTHYFWRALAENGVGSNYSSEQDFWTMGYPSAPTNFTITQTGPNSISINWTLGLGADGTEIRVSTNGYPGNVTEGYLAYNGTDVGVNINGLDLDTTVYYYAAYSWNSYDYSPDYAQAQVGGTMTATMIIGIICLGAMIAGFALRRVPLLIGAGMCWVAFGALMYTSTTESSMGVALFIIGLAFALLCFLYPLVTFLGGRRKRPNAIQRDYDNYKKQVMKATHREEV